MEKNPDKKSSIAYLKSPDPTLPGGKTYQKQNKTKQKPFSNSGNPNARTVKSSQGPAPG